MDYTGRPAKRQKGGGLAEIPDPLILTEIQCQTLTSVDINGTNVNATAIMSDTVACSSVNTLDLEAQDIETIAHHILEDPASPSPSTGFDTSIVYPAATAVSFGNLDRDLVMGFERSLRAVGTTELLRLQRLTLAPTARYTQDFQVVATSGGSMFFGFMVKPQCTSDTTDYYGERVGKRGWFFELFPDGRTLLHSNGQVSTSVSTYPLVGGAYECILGTPSAGQWTVRLFTPNGFVSETIYLTDVNGDEQVQFMVGDRSNVESDHVVRVDQLATPNDVSATPEVFTFERDLTGSLDLGSRGVTLSGNGVCVDTPLAATRLIETPYLVADTCVTDRLSVIGVPPQASTLALGEWDFIGTPGVVEISPSHVNFEPYSDVRAISSKSYFIPADLEVGGWVRYEYTVTGMVSALRVPLFGIHFKNAATKYSGFGTGFGESEYYHSLRGHASNSVIAKGGVVNNPSSPGYAIPNDSRVATRVMRTSAIQWTITHYFASGLAALTPVAYVTTFGEENAAKFCHAFAGVFTTNENSAQFSLPAVEYDRWHPVETSYTLEQNADNELECNDSTGANIFRCSANSYEISKPLVTDKGIAGNKGLFGYPCPVTSTYYAAHSGLSYIGIIGLPFELHVGSQSFGSPFIPRITPGAVFNIDASGILSTSGTNCVISLSVYIGNTLICTSSPAYKLVKNNTERVWTLHATIIPKTTNFNTGTVFCAGNGMFTYHSESKDDAKDSIEGFSLYDGGVAVGIPIIAPGDLRIVGEWDAAATAIDAISMIGCKFTYSGFNT